MRFRLLSLAIFGALGAAAACERGGPAASAPPAAARPDAPRTAPARLDPLIDSLLTVFRSGLPATDSLTRGERSLDSLGAAFVRAVAARDTVELRRLHVTRAEYGYLYFPTARIALPPYGTDPAVLWLQMTGTGESDLRRAFEAVPAEARYAGVVCPVPPRTEGGNRVHEQCLALVRHAAGRTDTLSLFGTVLERGGRFKLLSFVNKL